MTINNFYFFKKLTIVLLELEFPFTFMIIFETDYSSLVIFQNGCFDLPIVKICLCQHPLPRYIKSVDK